MNVLIISPYRTVVPHFETELDIAQQHLDQGDHVQWLSCWGGLSNCEFNVHKDDSICGQCRGRRNMGLELLVNAGSDERARFVDQAGLAAVCPSHEFNATVSDADLQLEFPSVEALIDYRVGPFDIGYAALSSLVSFCRDPEPDLEKLSATLKSILRSAWQVFHQVSAFLQDNPVDRVYVYNGRFAAMRAVLRACQSQGVDCYLHERGCDENHFELLKNHLPHDLEAIERTILDSWEAAAENPQREAVASQWFHDRVNRVEKVWHSFTKDQELGRLPDNWEPSKKNVSIFCSSDDEFVAIGDAWRNELYPNQVDGIERIVLDMLAQDANTKLYLRMHPNLKGVQNRRVQRMRDMDYPNLEVIPPEAQIDTYGLIRESDIVVSFGSSVGSEALFWGTPSVLLGPCFYQNLGGVYRSNSHEQTIRLLVSDLTPGDPQAALKYAYWFQTRGVPHQYFKAMGLFEGTFKGQVVYDRQGHPRTQKRRWWKRLVGSQAKS